MHNKSLDADTQHQAAASRRVLRAGQLQRYTAQMRHLAAIAALLIIPAVGYATDRGDEVVISKTGDPEMQAAREQAQATLDAFLKIERERPAGTEGFKLKVRVADGPFAEHFWVQPFRTVGAQFQGVLANEPQYVKTVKLGQVISFVRADISDWGYAKNGRQVGNFTVCAMFKRMPKEQVEYYRKNHGFDC
jgi:uncharacterized protein YegJ (DUF2314 family)